METYYAYGSNINARQIKERCPSAHFKFSAILHGYRFTFPIKSERWSGGVAGIIEQKGEKVLGVVYEISDNDLLKLDEFESHYYRKKISVMLEGGSILDTWTYFPNLVDDKFYPPTKEYLHVLIEGAKEHNFDEWFIKSLEEQEQNLPDSMKLDFSKGSS